MGAFVDTHVDTFLDTHDPAHDPVRVLRGWNSTSWRELPVSTDQPTGAQKRAFYATTFCIALGVDLLMSVGRGLPYRPSLIGLAIMIAAVLWFAASWIRDR